MYSVVESRAWLSGSAAFASFHGADFYGLPRNIDTIELRREAWRVPGKYPFGEHDVVPLRAGEELRWRVHG